METETNGHDTKGKRHKQLKIKGTERKDRNKAIEKAASAYVEARDARMELSKVEHEKKETLLKAVKDAKLPKNDDGEIRYRCDDEALEVILTFTDEKVKVKRIDEDDTDED